MRPAVTARLAGISPHELYLLIQGRPIHNHSVLLLCCCLPGMATPHVTGAVALYAAAYKRNTGANPTAAAIKAAVMNTGTASSTYTVCMHKGLS